MKEIDASVAKQLALIQIKKVKEKEQQEITAEL